MPDNGRDTVVIQPAANMVDDLIGHSPSWLLRSGIGLVALVVSILLTLASMISYPDVITGRGYMTSDNPPVKIVSNASGYIDTILVDDRDSVTVGDTLLIIHNTTTPSEIKKLTRWVDQYEKIQDPTKYLSLKYPENLSLGSIQDLYASMGMQYQELIHTLKNGLVFQQLKNLNQEIKKIEALNQSKQREYHLYIEELALVEKDFKRHESLHRDGVISDVAYEEKKSEILQAQSRAEGLASSRIQNEIRIEQLKLEKIRLQQNRQQSLYGKINAINEKTNTLKRQIREWRYQYCVVSNSTGKIEWQNRINQHGSIEHKQTLAYIIPTILGDKKMRCNLTSSNIGKVEVGQKVIIKVDAYPYKEFGQVESTVSKLARIPSIDKDGVPSMYLATIKIPSIMVTNSGKHIPYEPESAATINIITEEKNLLNRVFNEFTSLLNSIDS